jgi:hypothetical protein
MSAVQPRNSHGLARILDANRGASTVVFVPDSGWIAPKVGLPRVNCKIGLQTFYKKG